MCQPGADFISSFTVKVTMCLQQQPDEQQANVVRKVVCCFFLRFVAKIEILNVKWIMKRKRECVYMTEDI